ncbi:hypothetical protein [Paractinoplanes globisporus]|uniref:Type VII secretion protein EccE n=1 Tax=Paractinoplanes globisporus TaxID=113565 RepID=A0ABW6WKE8_9ACTN|nr:hypothetical protein [Actinoplanes globisporus]
MSLADKTIADLIAGPPPGSPPSLASCVPGRGGVPDSVIGKLECGSWVSAIPAAIGQVAHEWCPLLLAAVAVLAVLTTAWRVWRRPVWRSRARRARWLQLTPPVSATPAATVGLWKLLATTLQAPRAWTVRPQRLVWEVQAGTHAMRCGLWISPGVNPTAVRRILESAWPGVRVEETRPPAITVRETATTVMVRPTRPDWLPLVEDVPPPHPRPWEQAVGGEDPLRAVYDGLATAGRTGSGLLQVHVSRAPAARLRVLSRAATQPGRAHGRGPVRGLTHAMLRVLLGALDLLLPGSASRPRRTGPAEAELARQTRDKYQAGPHFTIAVYATATGPTKAAARSAAAAVTGGFGLLSAHFTRRRLRHGATAAAQRWVPPARMSLAAVTEVAALAGLPAEPALYGLPAAASRRRPGGRDIFRAGPTLEHDSTTSAPASSGEGGTTVWSAS